MVFQRILPSGWGRYGGVDVRPASLQFARAGFQEGLTLNRVQAALREGGIGIRRQALVEIRQELLGIQRSGINLRVLRPEFRPDFARIPRTNRSIPTRFRYTARLGQVTTVTGQVKDFFVDFGDDSLLTRAEIEERIRDISDRAAQQYGVEPFTVQNITIIRGIAG